MNRLLDIYLHYLLILTNLTVRLSEHCRCLRLNKLYTRIRVYHDGFRALHSIPDDLTNTVYLGFLEVI